MKKLIHTQKDLYWIDGQNNTVETYLSDETPDLSLCTASYAFVFKDKKFLQTELREGERPEKQTKNIDRAVAGSKSIFTKK